MQTRQTLPRACFCPRAITCTLARAYMYIHTTDDCCIELTTGRQARPLPRFKGCAGQQLARRRRHVALSTATCPLAGNTYHVCCACIATSTLNHRITNLTDHLFSYVCLNEPALATRRNTSCKTREWREKHIKQDRASNYWLARRDPSPEPPLNYETIEIRALSKKCLQRPCC